MMTLASAAALASLAVASPMGDSGSNLLANGSFSSGADPWYSLEREGNPYWRPFSVEADPLGAEGQAARLDLTSDPAHRRIGIWGVIQDLPEVQFIPERLSGRYFVADWVRGTKKQYLQVVCIAWTSRDYFGKGAVDVEKLPPVQVAFVLAGIERPPFPIRNRRFSFLGPPDPAVGRWIDFSIELEDEFKRLWGFLPEEIARLRILFEVRFDNLRPAETGARATVYFDDLFLGPEPRPTGPVS